MPFAAPPADFQHPRPLIASFSGYSGIRRDSGGASRFGITRQVLTVFRFGKIRYHLHRPEEGAFYPASAGGKGEFYVESFGEHIVGRGNTPTESCENWNEQFHVMFQSLYIKQTFEMNPEEQKMWRTIKSLVDVERYRMEQPLVVRQEGRVHKFHPYPVIRWEDGTSEKVRLSRMPPEFASYKVGQRFETIIERDPTTHKIRKVTYVKRLPQINISLEESDDLWNLSQTTNTLPDSSWD